MAITEGQKMKSERYAFAEKSRTGFDRVTFPLEAWRLGQ